LSKLSDTMCHPFIICLPLSWKWWLDFLSTFFSSLSLLLLTKHNQQS